MDRDEMLKLPHGVYHVYWAEEEGGGLSVATVGSLHDGTRWFAPTNWTSRGPGGIASIDWALVDRVERISLPPNPLERE